MNKKKIGLFILAGVIIIIIVLIFQFRTDEPKARKALENYLTSIQEGDLTGAYQLVSDIDKNSISEDIFNEWRTSVDQVVQKNSYRIEKSSDRFRNYEYMGTTFKDAYGFNVIWDQEYMISDAKTSDYDQDEFQIMVVEEDGSYKIALLITDIKERTDKYIEMLMQD